MFSALPYGVFKYESQEMQDAVRTLLAEKDFDAVLCDDVYLFKDLPPPVRAQALLNKHDFTFVIVRGVLARTHNPLKLAYGWLEYLKLRRWETVVSSSVASVLLCSERDGRVLQRMVPGTSMTTVPNVIDVSEYAPQKDGGNETLIFSGAMDYFSNQDAVEFFVSQILPEIRTQFPRIKLIVAGRNPPESFQRRVARTSGVIFTGTVPDMRSEIAKSSVCVVPLRIGSGTRLKILEAAAMCKPVVSTRIGAEGLDFTPGTEILLADEPKEFAKAVASLLKDGSLRESMGQAARRRVEKQYSIEALRVAVRDALSTLVAREVQVDQEGSTASSPQSK
ncbi:MAG: glycosyltransferase [Terriglobia bacterium]